MVVCMGQLCKPGFT